MRLSVPPEVIVPTMSDPPWNNSPVILNEIIINWQNFPPKKTEIDLDTRNFAFPPIYRVATLSNECKNAVDEYEEDSNVIKTVSQTLQNCILQSQCKLLKISLFLTPQG